MQHRSRFGRRLCVAVDAKSYGAMDNVAQYDTQALLAAVLDEAAVAAGLDRSNWLTQRQGDSELALVPPDQPEPRLVDDFIRELDATLRLRNHGRLPEARLRLRAAIDFGVAYEAQFGFAGEAVVATARLLGSEGLHHALGDAPDADLAVALSTRVYQTVLNRHTSLTAEQFYPITVSEKEYNGKAWIRVLRRDAPTPRPGQASDATPQAGSSRPTRHAQASRNRVENHFYDSVEAEVIGINIAAAPSEQA